MRARMLATTAVLLVALLGAPAAAQEAPTTTTVAGPAPVEAGPTLTVTPDTGLVDHQVVTVEGAGFAPRTFVSIFECEGGGQGTDGCAFPDLAYAFTEDDGSFSLTVGIEAVLRSFGGVLVDCRTAPGACELRAKPQRAASVAAPLDFDPSAPLATPSLTVTPNTGLVDGQVVQVDAAGFRPGSVLFVFACKGSVPSSRQCPSYYSATDDTRVDDTGAMSVPYRVRAVIQVDGGATVDCRVAHCFLSATERPWDEDLPMVPLEFDPDAPLLAEPTLAVTPSTGLADGQVVRVTGANWFPGEIVDVVQCALGRYPVTCVPGSRLIPRVDANGHFALDVEVRRTFRGELDEGTTVDCLVSACVMTAFWSAQNGSDRQVAAVPLAFAGASAPPATPTAVEPRFTG